VLSDTVGFITQLPHDLIAAFHATLEAATQADLLLHVVDAASPARDHQVDEVNQVLRQIGASQIAQLQVLNKIDLTGLEPGIERNEYGKIASVRVSARTGAGLDFLRQAIVEAANFHRAGGSLPDDNPSLLYPYPLNS
jgi:GTP-binding protein HflX